MIKDVQNPCEFQFRCTFTQAILDRPLLHPLGLISMLYTLTKFSLPVEYYYTWEVEVALPTRYSATWSPSATPSLSLGNGPAILHHRGMSNTCTMFEDLPVSLWSLH